MRNARTFSNIMEAGNAIQQENSTTFKTSFLVTPSLNLVIERRIPQDRKLAEFEDEDEPDTVAETADVSHVFSRMFRK